MRHLVTVLLAALAMLAAPSAYADLLQSPKAGGTYTPLDGATVKGSVNVRANGCPSAPSWTFALDGVTKNVEYTCPLDFGGDDYLLDTKTVADGTHVITMTPEGTGQALTAKFTVSNGTSAPPPSPPTDPTWTGGTTVGWVPPTTNADGSTLTDLAGFEIDYGTTTALGAGIRVANPAATSYRVAPLAAGTWYFTVSSYTAAGAQSDPSKMASFAVAPTTAPPPTCPAQPASQTRPQTCIAPLVGSWSQQSVWTSAPAPACWTQSWTPLTAPAGQCAAPSPLVTVDTRAYQYRSATLPMVLAGYVAPNTPCGPATQTVSGVKYCRIPKSVVDLGALSSIDLNAVDYWAKASP